jgi:hypothetical protein
MAAFAAMHAAAAPVYSVVTSDPELTVGGVTVGDPQSQSQTGTINALSVNSSVSFTSPVTGGFGQQFQNVSLSFSDAYNGAFTYNDGFQTRQGATDCYCNHIIFGTDLYPATSTYGFTLTTPGSITIHWSATFSQDLSIFPITFVFDGSTYRYYANGLYFYYAGYAATGTMTVPLGIGDHTLSLADFGGSDGGIGNYDTFETTRLSFQIAGTIEDAPAVTTAVPEPDTAGILVTGLALLGLVLAAGNSAAALDASGRRCRERSHAFQAHARCRPRALMTRSA